MSGRPDMRIPELAERFQLQQSAVMNLFVLGKSIAEDARLYHDGAGEWLWGFRIPPFQRPDVWTPEQSARFVESVWLGLPIGQYVVNVGLRPARDGKFPRSEGWLIDGQQRLRALKAYVEDAFPVFGLRWSELAPLEIRRFKGIVFPMATVSIEDEARLRLLYDRLNYGGTPHAPDQRAAPEEPEGDFPPGPRP